MKNKVRFNPSESIEFNNVKCHFKDNLLLKKDDSNILINCNSSEYDSINNKITCQMIEPYKDKSYGNYSLDYNNKSLGYIFLSNNLNESIWEIPAIDINGTNDNIILINKGNDFYMDSLDLLLGNCKNLIFIWIL